MKNLKSIILTLIAAASAPVVANAQTEEPVADSTDMVNVAYVQRDSRDILGGVSYVNIPEVFEKNFYSFSTEGLQALVSGFNGGSIRGSRNLLIIVDGVPREANNVLPSEIAQITVLKGPEASVLYGSIGSGGAVIITTKRGTYDGLKINARVSSGADILTNRPEYLNSAEYMETYNKVRLNDGKKALYSDEEIANTASGINPYRYPDLDFYSDEYLRKATNYTEANLEMDGGNQRTHFYSNVGYYRDGNPVKFGEALNTGYSRFNIRGNVDVKITNAIKAFVNANTTFYDQKNANGNFWSAAASMRPNYPENANVLIPIDMIDPSKPELLDLVNSSLNVIDGKYFLGGSQKTKTNEIAAIYAAGNTKFTSRQFQFDAGVNADLKSVLPGLYFQADFSIDFRSTYNTAFNNDYATFEPKWATVDGKDMIVGLKKMNEDKKSGSQNINDPHSNRIIGANAFFGYKNSFGKNNVNTMFVANAYQATNSGAYHRPSNANLGLLLDYNFDHKYYAAVNLAIPHTSKLAEGHRNGFSSTVELGWNLKGESFLKDNSIISALSIHGSWGSIDDAENINDWYLYADNWTTAWGYGWRDGNSSQYTFNQAGANPSLDFIKRDALTASIKAGFLDNMITVEGSVFQDKWSNFITQLTNKYPSFLKPGYPDVNFIPYENYGAEERKGFEFGVNFNKQFGEVSVSLGAFGMLYKTELTERDETWNNEYQNRVGKPLDAIWGYECLGIFQSQAEIDNYEQNVAKHKVSGTPKPGDLCYKDQNGDHVINSDDQVYLGKSGGFGNPFTTGLNLTVKYKNFTFFAMGYIYAGSYSIKSNSYYWMSGDAAKYSEIARDCWLPDNTSAKYPRLTTESSTHNYQVSDFWMFKNNYFDLGKVQLTYNFPSQMFEGKFVKAIQVYASAYDLLLISKEKDYLQTYIGSAPMTRRVLLGASFTF